ncbi:MAG TPA: hypothetical protein VNY36_06945 [Bacteroidia bacterium]|jgi:hypothetical protein|nr:hypothetical protein [Bacteroidia bacterium]
MNKFFNIAIEIIYWILFFLSPFLIFTIIAVILYLNNPINHWLPVALLIIGVISGIILAERIRRKYGTANYMGTLWGNSELTENKPDKKN